MSTKIKTVANHLAEAKTLGYDSKDKFCYQEGDLREVTPKPEPASKSKS